MNKFVFTFHNYLLEVNCNSITPSDLAITFTIYSKVELAQVVLVNVTFSNIKK